MGDWIKSIKKKYFSKPWQTWIGHGGIGFLCTLLFDELGYGFALGFYTQREWRDSKGLKNFKLDHFMDWVCPNIGGGLGLVVRRLITAFM